MEKNEIDGTLLSIAKESAQIYSPGRYIAFSKDPDDLTQAYSSEDISIAYVDAPEFSSTMQQVWNSRYKLHFPQGADWDNHFMGMVAPDSTVGKLGLPLFKSGYLDWKLALPWNDQHDRHLERDGIRPYLNIHHVPVTEDGYMIYGYRNQRRMTWQGYVFCTHSWGDDMDKKDTFDMVMDKLLLKQGDEIFKQGQRGIAREINPFSNSGNPFEENIPIKEIVSADDVEIVSASSLMLHMQPKDFGYHLGLTAMIHREAGEIVEARNKYPFEGRLGSLHRVAFTEDSMLEFFNKYHDRIATTIEPAIVMTCVQRFGEEFLKKLPQDIIRSKPN